MGLINGLLPDYKAIASLLKDYQELSYSLRGEFINAAINLETMIDEYLSHHFCSDEATRDDFVFLIAANRLDFIKKIEIIAYLIPKYDDDIIKEHPNFVHNCDQVRIMRNYLAHRYLSVPIDRTLGRFSGTVEFVNNKKELGKREEKSINDIKDMIDVADKYAGFLMDYLGT